MDTLARPGPAARFGPMTAVVLVSVRVANADCRATVMVTLR